MLNEMKSRNAGETRKRMNAKEKIMILRELLENKVQIGELSEKYGIHPNVIYNWKKTPFEKCEQLFDDKREKSSGKTEEKIHRLETKLKDKDSLIIELVEDNIRLKKISMGKAK
ncbi:MAG: transposase [Bacteroidota bacterium]